MNLSNENQILYQKSESDKSETKAPAIIDKDSKLDFQCQCKELLGLSSEKISMCSDYSNSRGENQKVISVSYYHSSQSDGVGIDSQNLHARLKNISKGDIYK